LKRNFNVFLKTGHFTSSLLKVIIVFCCAVLFALLSSKSDFFYHGKPSLYEHIANVLLVSLLTNFFNLLDVRPGRAIKGFLLLFVLLSILSHQQSYLLFPLFVLSPVFSAVLAYAPLDFRGQAMMGDAGSNMLGFVLGIGYAVILPFWWKVVIVILLTLFHIYCEFYSFSDFISRNRVLRFLDEFGTCMRNDNKRDE
jgi:UDP-N-acetylmuramyl pentapeptide phosphotransferase/UDP-N-acetylglucosamine-1-phosphate transferase